VVGSLCSLTPKSISVDQKSVVEAVYLETVCTRGCAVFLRVRLHGTTLGERIMDFLRRAWAAGRCAALWVVADAAVLPSSSLAGIGLAFFLLAVQEQWTGS